jgi:hypothetical protein
MESKMMRIEIVRHKTDDDDQHERIGRDSQGKSVQTHEKGICNYKKND